MKVHEDRRPSERAASYVYKCSMHPLVQFAHGGFCPQCGIALEPAKVWSRPPLQAKSNGVKTRFLIALIATGILGLVVVVVNLTDALGGRGTEWIEMLLATLVCLGSVWPFHLRAIQAASRGTFDMATLASLGMLAPYAAGTFAVLAPGILPTTFRHDFDGITFYFGTACAAATLVLLGQVLEEKVRGVSAKVRHGYLENPSPSREPGRTPIRRLAGHLMDFFAPAVLVAAVGTVVIWGVAGLPARPNLALLHGLALLLVACPCAFGLAAPLSLILAIRRAAASGVLFKDAEAIEMLSRIDTVAMGKSETLAMGRPELATVVAVPAFNEEIVLRYAASMEIGIRDHLALAIVQAAKERGIAIVPATELEFLHASGVRGKVDGHAVAVGNLSMMIHHDPESGPLGQQAEALRASGETVVYVSLDGYPIGLLTFHDRIREHALSEIRALRHDGLQIVLLSGDSHTTTLALAKHFEIDSAIAEIPFGGKSGAIAAIQEQGHRVAMVGHGEDDDEALGQADVGIEIGGTFDAGRKGVRISLLDGDFGGIAKARAISRAALRNIRQNLFLAFGGSALGVVSASGVADSVFGFSLTPEWAAIALFSLTALVVLNAFRSPR